MRLWMAFGLLSLLLVPTTAPGMAQSSLNEARLAFVSNRSGNEDVYVLPVSGQGAASNLTNHPARDYDPAWSPDGERIVFTSDRTGIPQLYTMNFNGEDLTPLLPDDTAVAVEASWSPDGDLIAFVSDRAGIGRDIYVMTPQGNGVTPITESRTLKGDPIWSPDGQQVVYWERQTNGDIHLFQLDISDGTLLRLSNRGPYNGKAHYSADSRFIYFDSNRDGGWHLYRMEANGNNPTRLTETTNSGRATLSPDGRRIAYVTDQGRSDELYVMDANTLVPRPLTSNTASDHSPAWQPVVPDIASEPPPVPTPTPNNAITNPTSFAVDQGFSGANVRPLTLQTILVTYGINAWHDAGWRGQGQRIGVIDTGFGNLDAFRRGAMS